jgi:RNA polymerase sigma-70 factor (ECF subfamily)
MSHLPESTLKHLLVEISQGNTRAFERIYQSYHSDVFRFVMHMRGDSADADEIVNDVFLALGMNPLAFKGDSSFTSWLLGIAKYKVYDRLRKLGRSIRIESMDELDVSDRPDPAGDVPTQAMRIEDGEALSHCREQLPDVQKEAIYWAYVRDASMQEIAEVQQCSTGTVKSRLFNARKFLRQCIKTFNQGPQS